MRLTTLNPRWVGHGGEGVFLMIQGRRTPVPRRYGVGVTFDCPCGCAIRCFIPFDVPLDGGPPIDSYHWTRQGDTFDTLTLRPSILRAPEKGGCGWHGFITKGEVCSC